MSATPLQEHWVKIADSVDALSFGSNHITELLVDRKRFCVARYREQLYAFPALCPHAGAAFINGFVDALGNVVCPLHHYRFSLKNGHNTSGEGYHLRRWRIDVRPDGIYINWNLASLM